MSAENKFAFFRMDNGQIWIGIQRCGGTVAEVYGEVEVVAKCATYDEAVAAFARLTDEDSDELRYTEHGGALPSFEELQQKPVHPEHCTVVVRFAPRLCGCVDRRDLQVQKWQVGAYGLDHEGKESVLADGLWYTEAITFANWFAIRQPGECTLLVPTMFRRLESLNQHDCEADHWGLALPPNVVPWELP